MKEVWKPVKGYETKYEVSNKGRIKSWLQDTKKGRILKCGIDRHGYWHLFLCKDRELKYFSVHRLVAIAFIENPLNLPVVNHINNKPGDNNVFNLEWCTTRDNFLHSIRTGRRPKKYNMKPKLKKIIN